MKKHRKVRDERAAEYTTEQICDGGIMTLRNSSCYQDVIGILLANGYYVCCHCEDDGTITLEYWRA